MKKPANKLIVNLSEANLVEKLAEHILLLLSGQEQSSVRPVIVLCIGSDRYTGDALGPLVGSYLTEQNSFRVYGTLDKPVHAGNLADTIRLIRSRYTHPVIIALDACLGKTNEVGNIEIWEGCLEAGIAVGHKLPKVGEISIVGVVNSGGYYSYIDLQTTSLSIVVKLSKAIGEALVKALLCFGARDAAAGLVKASDETTYPT